MRPDQLDRRVAFDEPHQVSDGYGGHERGWREMCRRAAHFRWLRGSETAQAARLEGRQLVVATVRADSTSRQITVGCRMRDLRTETRNTANAVTEGAYNIRAIVDTDDRQFLEITAERGVAI